VVEIVEGVVIVAPLEQLAHMDLARVVVDRAVLENRMVDARDLVDVEAADRLAVGLVARVLLGAARRQGLQVNLVPRIGRVVQVRVEEHIDEEGDALVAVAAMGVAGVGEEAHHSRGDRSAP
jgi:hypothetical protein